MQTSIWCTLRQQGTKIWRASSFSIEMQMQWHTEGLQLIQKCRTFAITCEIHHLERLAHCLETTGHAQHGCDADTASHQHRVRSTLIEREVVARLGDRDGHGHAQCLVHAARTTAAGAVAQHAYDVAMALIAIVGQRVAANQPVGQVQIDVRARCEGGELTTVDGTQVHADRVLRLKAQRVHKGLQGGAHDAMPSSICSWA